MIINETMEFQGHTLTIESGKIARQADGAVWIRYGDAVMLVTAVSAPEARPDQDFFPLTCDYVEKTYAAGKIPGGFFKREARQSEAEILNCRMMDRPIRPLFANGYMNETQVIATMISFDPEIDPSTMAIFGASAALHVSNIPFEGPVGAVRIGRIADEWVVNPSFTELDESAVNVVVVASRNGIVMVEGGAFFLPEETFVEGLMLAEKAIQPLLDMQDRMRETKGVTVRPFTPPTLDAEIGAALAKAAEAPYKAAQSVQIKLDRQDAYRLATKAILAEVEVPADQMKLAKAHLGSLKKGWIREMMRTTKGRLDGRDFTTVRPINCEIGILPRVHGSSLFTRGETQVIAAVTLGTSSDEQRIDSLLGDTTRKVMLHYNFPPYSVGEARFLRGPSRRDIGHGSLALTGITPILPPQDDFPYTIRIVSEVTESNGSSSMATVCGTSMSLMQAGVPVQSPVAGIAMGLIQEEGDIIVLTDIIGDEDHYGDMDFKVVGNREGITAIQMDIKIDSISEDILLKALSQARDARLHILSKMEEAISEPADELSPFAPQIVSIQIPEDRIRYLIGPGGKYIRGIQESTGAVVNVDDQGVVQIAAMGKDSMDAAVAMVKEVAMELEEGETYKGRITKITDFGAFVQLMPGTEGLLHISEYDHKRIGHMADVVAEGDDIEVKLLAIEPGSGKLRLSRRALIAPPEPGSPEEAEMKASFEGGRQGGGGDRGGRGGDRGGRGGDRGGRGGGDRGRR